MKTYKDEIFCDSDCQNMECFRYYDAGTLKDAEQAGLPMAFSDYSRVCPHYLSPSKYLSALKKEK